MSSELVKAHHLQRRAVIYVRQSTHHQVLTNQESLRLQYALRQRARDLGWREADIEVVDCDLGLSGATATSRQGFKEVVARVTLGEVGMILSIEVTRLARNCSDWYPLLDVCGYRQCLIGDRDGIYDPALPDGRLLLGLKGHDLGGGTTHHPRPADRWPAQQGGTRRIGLAAASRIASRFLGRGHQGPRSGSAGADRAGIR
jgi:hypothetical protein